MKKASAWRNPFLLAGLALVCAANAIVLWGVAANRRGEPDSTLRLGLREAAPPWAGRRDEDDNSGLALTLRWQRGGLVRHAPAERAMGHWYDADEVDWLDEAKLRALGMALRPPRDPSDSVRIGHGMPSVEALLVLEFDGPAYRRALEEARRQAEAKPGEKDLQEALAHQRDEASRLFVVDAGQDLEALRRKYPDRARHAIVRGTVQAYFERHKGVARWGGRVMGLSIAHLHVPASLRPAFEALPTRGRDRADAGRDLVITVSYGRRLEPWIADAKAVPPPSRPQP